MYAVLILALASDFPMILRLAFYAVLLAGTLPVLITANDAGNGGDGKYIVRIPLFK